MISVITRSCSRRWEFSPTNETVLGNNNLGTLKGTRALEIVTTYVGAFLDFVIHGKSSALLDGPVERFPEVTFEY